MWDARQGPFYGRIAAGITVAERDLGRPDACLTLLAYLAKLLGQLRTTPFHARIPPVNLWGDAFT